MKYFEFNHQAKKFIERLHNYQQPAALSHLVFT